ncbi:CCA tRNA nucleotidyltransferase [Calidifontibacillus erzurumensis]|uniref:CCA-adding enzyme n=1 Tax=Calidifontibacillus erzurumensis TaxID=2741433 RepID=A0A8J8KBT1_9BACI|nr:CCA tRNA nucleotidyltransferase [Calidifontibacillus erzurumensis]NSL52269.1 CCA tRNA nucleotidyltransferase [Calidifontibacillus erzurumensis]
MKEPFLQAKPILKKLIEAGFEAYFVGGSVRDHLLKRKLGDVDIATSALPEDVERLFPKTIPVGIKHGTVVVIHDGVCYEVTTFRIDGEYKDFRRPSEVKFVTSLEQDLSRRDFTINAIAMDISGKIIDPFNGIKDLQKKVIQTVGIPDDRFLEDPLRMMRAIRFVSQLDFVLSEETKKSIQKHAHYLKNIAVERILIEFEKLLEGKAVDKALSLILELQIYKYLPGFADKKSELLTFAKNCLKLPLTLEEQWALLITILKIENIESFFREWKSSNEKIRTCKQIISALNKLQKGAALTPYFIYTTGKNILLSSIKLLCILENRSFDELADIVEIIHKKLPIYSRKELALTGIDVMDWYQKKGGPWLAQIINDVEKAVVEGIVQNTKADIKEWLLKCNPPSENNY